MDLHLRMMQICYNFGVLLAGLASIHYIGNNGILLSQLSAEIWECVDTAKKMLGRAGSTKSQTIIQTLIIPLREQNLFGRENEG